MNPKIDDAKRRRCVDDHFDGCGHLRTNGISSMCGGVTMTLGGRGTAVLNSNLCMQNNTLAAGRLHATEGETAHCISASSLVTAGCISASGLMTAETVVARNSVHVGKVLTVEGGAIQQQGGGGLVLGAPLAITLILDAVQLSQSDFEKAEIGP